MPSHTNDADLLEYKKVFKKDQYNSIVRCFELLWGGQSKYDEVPGAQIDGTAALTEQNFMKNIKYIVGEDEPYFGKMLYLWMSNGYDRAKITICEFIEFLIPFRGEDKAKQLRHCYEIFDIDHDGTLNILNLLHVNKYIKPRTLLAREVIIMIDEYLAKNILNNNKRLNRVEIEFENFHKLLISSCIRDEIRRKFWSINEEYGPNEPHSMCTVMEGEQLHHFYTESMLEDKSFLFDNIDYYDDVLPG